MILLGFDIGSSSVKASLVEAESGQCIASAFYPKQEAPILSHQAGWAEQEPEDWWNAARDTVKAVMTNGVISYCDGKFTGNRGGRFLEK